MSKNIKQIRFIVALLSISSFWFPFLRHYHVSYKPIDMAMVEAARKQPKDEFLRQLTSDHQFDLIQTTFKDKDIISTAENLLSGNIEWTSGKTINFGMPPEWSRADELIGPAKLYLHSLVIAKTLTRAHKISNEIKYLEAAQEIIESWVKFDDNTWLPVSLQWNDHAAAERMLVLGEFWSVYRNYNKYNADFGKTILCSVARHAAFLADPRHFRFSSNHGMMQTAALLYSCLAFPTVLDSAKLQNVAVSRLLKQMKYYINDEGVVLEHSPGYHYLGIHLLGICAYDMKLIGQKIPDDWEPKYNLAKRYLINARRPDGSMPAFGDTANHKISKWTDLKAAAKLTDPKNLWEPVSGNSPKAVIYPKAGYAFFLSNSNMDYWGNNKRQLAVTWSYYPNFPHKHADELSIGFWADGKNWVTNAGYWQYGTKGRKYAESWLASNAPHFLGEHTNSQRYSTLLAHGSNQKISFIDLKRTGPGNSQIRRQVIFIRPDQWAVIDSGNDDASQKIEVIWMIPKDLKKKTGSRQNQFYYTDTLSGKTLSIDISSPAFVDFNYIYGETPSMKGWLFIDGMPEEAHTVSAQIPTDGSYLLTMNTLLPQKPASTSSDKSFMEKWHSPDSWTLVIPGEIQQQRIKRTADKLIWTNNVNKKNISLQLIKPHEEFISNEYQSTIQSFRNTKEQFPEKFMPHIQTRKRISFILLCCLFFQELLLNCNVVFFKQFGVKNIFSQKHNLTNNGLLILWLLGSTLLHLKFL